MSVVLFGVFVLLIILTIPIAYALGLASAVWVILSGMVPMIMVPQRMYAGIDSFPLIAIPSSSLRAKLWRPEAYRIGSSRFPPF